ncbi:MAG: type II toxin-antitoxin system PemK/MazF family toxin [Calditrichia bacterium]|nr:type II toxin-antitoxin system PemK/MazF family toxin [Calditrichia bacterium]
MERGEIRWYTFKSPDKKRPVVILLRSSALKFLGEVTAAPITSTIRDIPTEVVLDQQDGMKTIGRSTNCTNIQMNRPALQRGEKKIQRKLRRGFSPGCSQNTGLKPRKEIWELCIPRAEARGYSFMNFVPCAICAALKTISAINLDHIQTVSKDKIGAYITKLSEAKLEEIKSALLFALGFDD